MVAPLSLPSSQTHDHLSHIPATCEAPLSFGVCSVSSHCAVRSGQRQNQHQPGLLPAGAPLPQIWRSRGDDAFELQLPELPSPHNSLAEVQDGLWSNGSIQVDVKLYLQKRNGSGTPRAAIIAQREVAGAHVDINAANTGTKS